MNQKILQAMQDDPNASQRDLAVRVGMSQNACWRRIRQMEEAGIIRGSALQLDRHQLGLGLVVFTLIRTRNHSAAWLREFRRHVLAIPDVVDFYRIGGDFDYMLRIVTENMQSYDRVYQKLIEGADLDAVTSYFAMEGIAENRPLPI
ncbi:Lrp/AsnC family transcriptional regulator [Falsirhodobacter sp. alg1]|uniref:Lrp/AsnC family transcriptional regulator n=1 Tax=Falsirhodobacter sp. alg1 TaxID=1472418 RepID=UPI001EDBA74F|nr:Lrp/AsnC family transcriptional regulator [Falsirhodobacter sp. alg1]